MGGTTPWSQVKAEHDAKRRAELGPVRYQLSQLRMFFYGKRIGLRWRYQRGVGFMVRLLQRLCGHDQAQIIRAEGKDDGVVYLSICGFCQFIEIDEDDDVLDEAFRRADEFRAREEVGTNEDTTDATGR